jgi:electron transfer flavoprotein alpha subunit
MSGILVFAEVQDGAFAKGSLGLLDAASRLGQQLAEPVHALVVGSAASDADAATLGSHGASIVHVADGDGYSLSQPLVDAVCTLQETHAFRYLLFGASIVASDAAAAVAVRLDAGLVIDVVELCGEDGGLVTRRAGLGDSVLAHCGFTTPVGVVVVRANTYAPAEAPAGLAAATVEHFTPALRAFSTAAQIVGHEVAEQSGVDISEADVLVGGGRGLGQAENFALCEALASALGGAVAATRAVVDAGWYPYSSQVGQTGKSVSPKCYIAVGISGAIQHKVGMQSSHSIVAINKDPNAPIFDFADFGVVGDLHQIVPKLTELVRARKQA